jgi:hypothetical protein
LSVSRQVNSLFQTEFSKECDLELPPSTSNCSNSIKTTTDAEIIDEEDWLAVASGNSTTLKSLYSVMIVTSQPVCNKMWEAICNAKQKEREEDQKKPVAFGEAVGASEVVSRHFTSSL